MTFKDLNIGKHFIDKLTARRITEPTDIQKEVVPRV
jgi:superfamily II DNA/RNA helicase